MAARLTYTLEHGETGDWCKVSVVCASERMAETLKHLMSFRPQPGTSYRLRRVTIKPLPTPKTVWKEGEDGRDANPDTT